MSNVELSRRSLLRTAAIGTVAVSGGLALDGGAPGTAHAVELPLPKPKDESSNVVRNGDALVDYIVGTERRDIPAEIIDEAKKSLVDWVGVCLGAREAPEARIVAQVAASWGTSGRAPMLTGGKGSPSVAALVNGTLSHCLDFDDTHIPTALHTGGVTWAAVLAAAAQDGRSEKATLRAFVTGFEVGTRIGAGGIGVRLNDRGWHTTPVLGRFSGTAAVAALRQLGRDQTAAALGVAATQVGGFTASFGTMSKPFHAGKTAMDSILSVELAERGFGAATSLFDAANGCFPTLFQSDVRLSLGDLESGWEITHNSFKPYAACQLTHAAIDAAIRAHGKIGDAKIAEVHAYVHPLAIKIANLRNPANTTQAKFSLAYCIALGLTGHNAGLGDFAAERLADRGVRELESHVQATAEDGIERTATRLEIHLADGRVVVEDVQHALGSVGNPLGWSDLRTKFIGLSEPVLGARATDLFDLLCNYERPGSMNRMFELILSTPR